MIKVIIKVNNGVYWLKQNVSLCLKIKISDYEK